MNRERLNQKNQTRGYIIKALFELLSKKTLSSITVKALMGKAGYDRSTFYLHFESKTDVLLEFFKRMLLEYTVSLDEIDDTDETADCKQNVTNLLRLFLRHKKEMQILHERGLIDIGAKIFIGKFLSVSGDSSIISEKNSKTVQHVGGLYAVIMKWVSQGMSLDLIQNMAEEWAKIITADEYKEYFTRLLFAIRSNIETRVKLGA
jgi:AcrR family transcriptional regulator